ncbi:hypothetical protein PGT21_028524 [Puccinia graminis f. sp. tritici]|uniref:RING-type domain-containing protein n=1 Tax=Puccinia graminis f. sp. tritici TaxID=56615 RepID=A0A5B0Q6S5_PUCGR|nr:hypothetical protein PGT21_028524 [Puccinia graminis f. sp. tritici]
MDPNSTPSDSESADSQLGQSPGGFSPSEERVGHGTPSPSEPNLNAGRDDEPVAPETPQPQLTDGAQRIAPPQEPNAAVAVRGTMHFQIDDEDMRLRDAGDHPGMRPEAVAFVRQLRATSEDNMITPVQAWQEILQSLPSGERIIFENFPEATNRVIQRLINQTDPVRLDTLLDRLTNTNLTALLSDSPQTDSIKCTVCLQEYVEADGVVVLPCHPSHHFHRACIHTSDVSKLPGIHSVSNLTQPAQSAPGGHLIPIVNIIM